MLKFQPLFDVDHLFTQVMQVHANPIRTTRTYYKTSVLVLNRTRDLNIINNLKSLKVNPINN